MNSTSDETLYYLAFSHFLGIGPVKFDALVAHFGSVDKAYEADANKLKQVLKDKLTEKFIDFRKTFNPIKAYEEITKKSIQIIPRNNQYFPRQLREISDAPICLYVRGNIDNFSFEKDLFIGIVGTRIPTSYGVQVTKMFASQLVQAGCIIVSGMAMGVDAVAHRAALDAKGKTIAFLGCGVDIVYPPANKSLYDDILKKGSLIMSEFPPGMTTLRGLFVARNRLISGLSHGVLVAEGLKDSGSLITARNAAEQGKEVFAPPAPINSRLSEAPNLLIKEGAKMVTSSDDILEEFQVSYQKTKTQYVLQQLSKEEQSVFTILQDEPLLPDDLSYKLKSPVSTILSLVSSMEIQGVIEKNMEGKYQVKLA
jgi:DNA processing protein